MKESKFNILSTRPLSDAVVERAAQKGVTIDVVSFIEIKNILDEQIEKQIISFAAQQHHILITSMNAADVVIDLLKKKNLQPSWTIFSLAGTTGKLLYEYFSKSTIICQAKDAAELAPFILKEDPAEVIFFCGNIRREALPATMKAAGIDVQEVVVYETIEIPIPVEKEYDAVLFYSPSAVRSYFKKNKLKKETVVFAIGTTTAAEVKLFCNNRIIESDFPSKENMVEQAIEFFK